MWICEKCIFLSLAFPLIFISFSCISISALRDRGKGINRAILRLRLSLSLCRFFLICETFKNRPLSHVYRLFLPHMPPSVFYSANFFPSPGPVYLCTSYVCIRDSPYAPDPFKENANSRCCELKEGKNQLVHANYQALDFRNSSKTKTIRNHE